MSDLGILVVDDSPDIRRLVEIIIRMRDHGWQVVGLARDGQEGVHMALAEQPELVLLDVSMPVMDGLEAVPLIRQAVPSAVIVMLTGMASPAVRDSALGAGADAFLLKDDLVHSLVPQLESILDRG